MSLSVLYSRANIGIDAPQIVIEVHISNGLPGFNLVGLPETSVREAKDRVRSAIINSGFEYPSRKITVNMAPADLPKVGSSFDLGIAIGILHASEQLKNVDLEKFEFVGELALSGDIRPIAGILPIVLSLSDDKRSMFFPEQNRDEAAFTGKPNLISASSLTEVHLHLTGKNTLDFVPNLVHQQEYQSTLCMSDIVGQVHAKRSLTIAASGRHNLLLFGPAGTGKSMLASRLMTILPRLTREAALENASIRSVFGLPIDPKTLFEIPFRDPHHSCSATALVGGGRHPKPGEISLAHQGILFLDELPEFGRKTLDLLREPLETKRINISRAAYKTTYPCNFQLICAMNPSPTGDTEDNRATNEQVIRYLNRLSGPFLDRIDIQIYVPKVNIHEFQTQSVKSQTPNELTSSDIRDIVFQSQRVQLERQGTLNGELCGREIDQYCQLSKQNQCFLLDAMNRLKLSMRGYHRLLKVSRTIADMENCATVEKKHISEALSFRGLDKLLLELRGNGID